MVSPTGIAPVRPELLAPAGDWECVRAAVENGADAIYFGLSRFNARMRAKNFTEADLPALMEFIHRRGVRGYVTFNTLIFENELASAEDYLRSIIAAGVDAAIVQDVGICRLIRELSPNFPIHASTQMTVTSPAGVDFAKKLGCQLVVLARECSIAEIQRIHQANPLPIEVFVHGALCVAYSGQCLTSESLGGRSANRGECAQACRLPYDLISDGRQVPLGDRRYLLSPQDLSGLEVLPELVQAGISSLKIEGRLKSPDYVASITRVYRQALDRALAAAQPEATDETSSRAWKYDLEMGFSRGLYTGWFKGIDNQELVHARFGKKRGVFLGTVSRVTRDSVWLQLESPTKLGDGIVFDAGTPDQGEEGGRIYEIKPAPGGKGPPLTELKFGHGHIDFQKVKVGDKVWKTSDPELERRVRQTYDGDTPKFRRQLRAEVHGKAGEPMTLILRDEMGHTVEVHSTIPLASAQNRPLTTEVLREQIGRLGGTGLCLGGLTSHLEGEVLLPLSELNRIRREAVSQIEQLRAQPQRWTLRDSQAYSPRSQTRSTAAPATPELIVLVRNLAQLQAVLTTSVATIYCEFEDPKKYREAVTLYRQSRPTTLSESPAGGIFVAPPRIFKPGEEWILKLITSCEADGVLIRNYDHLTAFPQGRKIGDFSLNVANSWTADYFLRHQGLERVTASYDLNFEQLAALLESGSAPDFEITIHQHMPMFHMEHCVFCAFMSSGKDYHDCGRPCEKHDVRLKDRVGQEHPLKADAGCRNTVYNALAQTGAEYVQRMIQLGVVRFRLEFLNESPQVVLQTLEMYDRLLQGEVTGSQLWQELKLRHQLGVTRGQMERNET
ncbi:MAG: U32 family peptidase [Verrucomicrobiales bacterium]|nr:U32 family peptidase [Verrucomicrobiales bacterium]